jgi:hypothetical protein
MHPDLNLVIEDCQNSALPDYQGGVAFIIARESTVLANEPGPVRPVILVE